jgi:acetyl esterase/lipase
MHLARASWLLVIFTACSALRGQLPPVEQNIAIRRDIVYRTVEGTALALDLYRPEGDDALLPAVIAFPGWIAGDRSALQPVAEYLAGMGFVVAAVECRPVPRWIFPAQLEDARAAVAWVRDNAAQCGIDAERCFLLGVSAGGQLAGLLGTQDETAGQFAGVVLLGAPTDLTMPPPGLKAKIAMRMYLGAGQDERPELYAAASPLTYVSTGDPPFLLVHGEEDEYVPPAQSARMVEGLRAKKVAAALLTLAGIGHELPALNTMAGITMMRAVLDFLANPRAKIP